MAWRALAPSSAFGSNADSASIKLETTCGSALESFARRIARRVSAFSSVFCASAQSGPIMLETTCGLASGSSSSAMMARKASSRSLSLGLSAKNAWTKSKAVCRSSAWMSFVMMTRRASIPSSAFGSNVASARTRERILRGAVVGSASRSLSRWWISPQRAELVISSGWWGARFSLRERIRAWLALFQSFGSVWGATSSMSSSSRSLTTSWAGVGRSVW